MTTNVETASIPRYVLLKVDESPDGPRCHDYAGEACTAIYGFTVRQAYELFCSGLTEARHPYPLVSGYLTRVFDQPGLKLVVIDSKGPGESRLNATIAEEAFAVGCDPGSPVAPCYRLSLIAGTAEYDVERLGLCGAD